MANFAIPTLRRIQRFTEGKEKLLQDYPDLTIDVIKEYIVEGEGEITADAAKRIDELKVIRQKAISFELQKFDYLPENYRSGEAFDASFSPEELARCSKLCIYNYFRW